MDYVLFQDGTHWGPNSLGQGAKLEGIQQGWTTAIGRVKQLLVEKGSSAVIDYLNQYQE
ncbi:MAG: hypothetical protein IRZ15_04305 [Bryobacteraceae bacterium]|nr:hypothetical protein [Bryobacteraceae bacterium]